MKYIACLLLLVLCACQGATPRPTVSVMGGVRDFDDSQEWEQTDQQTNVVGAQVDFAERDGFGLELGVTYSQDSSPDDRYINRRVDNTDTNVREIFAGLRKNWMLTDNWQISCGGGMSALQVETHVYLSYPGSGSPQDQDVGYAPYAQVGTAFFLTDNLMAGVQYRRHFFNENADIFIINPDLDCEMYLLTLGWSF